MKTTTEAAQVVSYSVSDAAIAELRSTLAGLSPETREGYEQVKQGIGACRKLRGEIEETRVELKAEALEWGRKVDAEAARLKSQILEIENPLKAAKTEVDERAERAREAAEIAEAKALADAEKARREAEAAEMAAARAELAAMRRKIEEDRAADEQRRADERRAELDRQQAEAAAVAARQAAEAAALAAERAALAAERKAIDDAKKKAADEAAAAAAAAEREAFEQQAREQAEREARERVEAEKREAEAAAARAEAERIEAEKKLEAMRPDVEKIRQYVVALSNVPQPKCTSAEAIEFVDMARNLIGTMANGAKDFAAAVGSSTPTNRRKTNDKQTNLI
jgi:chromosome segregation ATPase